MLAEDRRLVLVVFEFEEVVEGVFEKERGMLDAGIGEASARLLIKLQALRLGEIHHRLPLLFGGKDQAEVARVNALRRSGRLLREVTQDMIDVQVQRAG